MKTLMLIITIYHGNPSNGGWSESIYLGDYDANDCIEMAYFINGGMNDTSDASCEPIEQEY